MIRLDMRLSDRVVLAVINRTPTISQRQIAYELECHERSVMRAIARLRAAGYVVVSGAGNRTSYTYEIRHEQLPARLLEAIKNG